MAPGVLKVAHHPHHQGLQVTPVAKRQSKSRGYTLLDYKAVTSDYEPLAFQAAASFQVQLDEPQNDQLAAQKQLLVSSPYNNASQNLDLTLLETPNRLLALALSFMMPTRRDYATAPYTESFNWDEIFKVLKRLVQIENFEWRREEFYVVVFRSRLKENIDGHRLGELDFHSQEEANISGGLLKYWFGQPNHDRRNLATCLWRSNEDARAGGTGPWHKLARVEGADMYETIDFHTHRLVVEVGVESWRLEDLPRRR